MMRPDAELIAVIERHLKNVRAFGRDCAQSRSTEVMAVLVDAAEPIEEARERVQRLRDINRPGGCFSATQANQLGRRAQEIEGTLAEIQERGGPHAALLGLILVTYRQLVARRWDPVLRPEDDAEITQALRRYAESGV